MTTDAKYFDICDFLFTNDAREIAISTQSQRVRIREERFGDTDVWIVPGTDLENTLQERFRSFYPMFFGVLLSTLHEKKTQAPIRGIYWDDLDRAFVNEDLQGLADSIATGTYLPGVAKPDANF